MASLLHSPGSTGRSVSRGFTLRASCPSSHSVLPGLAPLNDGYEAAHAFAPFANWLVPGRVMLGRYPHVEKSRCASEEQGRAQLKAVLGAGVSTFVCLQDELPPQGSFPAGATIEGFAAYKPVAESIRAAAGGGAAPLHFVHAPIVDMDTPLTAMLHRLLADLRTRLAGGETLYIHCWGGRGRAGTVGATLLASAFGVQIEEALERVQRAYNTRNDEQPKSPETAAQFAFIRRYAEEHA
ncbi:hypothetical protein FOA52_014863 [Chlamydomonas sp. UWO 241]|nr:hypothetical protein FOA52_014863 [Chlamydomonas sp. UWO 241]